MVYIYISAHNVLTMSYAFVKIVHNCYKLHTSQGSSRQSLLDEQTAHILGRPLTPASNKARVIFSIFVPVR